jgi:microsomal epoxide hydrolase
VRTILLALLLNLVAPLVVLAQDNAEVTSGSITTTDGARLHYLEAGTGRAILFVPGWTGAAEFWEAQIHHFARSYRVVAMDPRSQGDSSKVLEGNYRDRRAQDIKEVVDQLRLGPVVLVGWSMAVGEVLSVVEQFGTGDLRALVLVDGGVTIGLDPQARGQDLLRALQEVDQMQVNRAEFVNRQARAMFNRPHTEEFYQRVIAANLKTPTDVAAILWMNQRVRDYRPTLQRIDRPVLFFSQDEAGRLRHAEIVRQEIPAARIEVFNDSGHALFMDEPERFNTVMEDFLRSEAGEAGQ